MRYGRQDAQRSRQRAPANGAPVSESLGTAVEWRQAPGAEVHLSDPGGQSASGCWKIGVILFSNTSALVKLLPGRDGERGGQRASGGVRGEGWCAGLPGPRCLPRSRAAREAPADAAASRTRGARSRDCPQLLVLEVIQPVVEQAGVCGLLRAPCLRRRSRALASPALMRSSTRPLASCRWRRASLCDRNQAPVPSAARITV